MVWIRTIVSCKAFPLFSSQTQGVLHVHTYPHISMSRLQRAETTSQTAWLFHEPTTEAWRAVGYRDWHNIWAHEQKSCLCVSETVNVRVCVFVTACINTIWYNKSFFVCVCPMLWGLVNCLTICLSLLCVSRFVICWYQLASTPAGQQNLPFFYTFIHPSFSFADSICHFFRWKLFFSSHTTTLYLHKLNEKNF